MFTFMCVWNQNSTKDLFVKKYLNTATYLESNTLKRRYLDDILPHLHNSFPFQYDVTLPLFSCVALEQNCILLKGSCYHFTAMGILWCAILITHEVFLKYFEVDFMIC